MGSWCARPWTGGTAPTKSSCAAGPRLTSPDIAAPVLLSAKPASSSPASSVPAAVGVLKPGETGAGTLNTYGEANQGELFAYFGSAGFLELAVPRQSAARLIEARRGLDVEVVLP